MIFAGENLGSASLPARCLGASETVFCPYGAANRGGIAVDSHGNLWMADVDNHRVLEFDRPFENGAVADRVLGQGGSFTSRTCNLGGLSARSLCFPGAVALDAQDHLYVADLENHRVLLFEHPLTDDAASKVFGQEGFTQGDCNQGHAFQPGAATLCLGEFESESNPHFVGASSLAVDPRGNLYVADTLNNRVLVYRDPLGSDAVADEVFGQDGFHQTLHGTGARRFAPGWLAVAVAPSGEALRRRPRQRPCAGVPEPLAGHHGGPRLRARRSRGRRLPLSGFLPLAAAAHGLQPAGAHGGRRGRGGEPVRGRHGLRPRAGVRPALIVI